MIVSNRSYMFGTGQVGVVQTAAFRCAVSTSPEGVFKGYSTLILTFDGDWGTHRNQIVVGKATLRPGLSSKMRTALHEAVLAHFDVLGEDGMDIADAVDEVFVKAKEMNLIDSHLNMFKWDKDIGL